ncbi:heat stress transcription factor B-1 isoform X2 [Elaeis guineensis]|uniref:heat stress transcription factor B-1 isoform X2 n=1 Tax=Elaeis guineensis var. tenera TaxID=51953 RepID=UPI003C6D68F0
MDSRSLFGTKQQIRSPPHPIFSPHLLPLLAPPATSPRAAGKPPLPGNHRPGLNSQTSYECEADSTDNSSQPASDACPHSMGFRKVVPDRWEFANENFRQGEQRLLREIRRRKAAPPQAPPAGKSNAGQHHPHPPSSTSNSGEVHSSSSTSSPPPPPPPPPQQLFNWTNENDKLKKDNKRLGNELAQAKKRCRELLGVLSKFMDVGALDIGLLMREKGLMEATLWREETKNEKIVEEEVGKKEEGPRLFGVLLKGFEGEESKKSKREKRRRCEEGGEVCGAGERPMKMGFGAPWMRLSTPVQQGSGKVYN